MKVATLVAAIFSALELLVQAFNLSLNFIHPQLNFQAVSIVEGMVFLLFTASLCCFFLVLYTKQQS